MLMMNSSKLMMRMCVSKLNVPSLIKRTIHRAEYGLFNFNKENKDNKLSKQKMKDLQDQLKKYKEERKFMIRKPFNKEYFISAEERMKQQKITNEALNKYLSEYKFEQTFIEEKFIAILSQISQTVDNKNILERKDFQALLLDRAEKSYLFKQFRQFCLFFAFCSVQGIDHPSLWECFNGFVASNYINFTINEKLLLLQSVNSINQHEFECFFEIFETELLRDIQSTQIPNFEKIFQLLSLYRSANQGSNDFYETLEQIITENIDEISIPNLTLLATHYSNNQNEKHASKIRMMKVFEQRILKVARFLNPEELIALFYSFIKIGQGSELLFRSFEERIFLMIEDFRVQQIENLLIIASNRDSSKRAIFTTVEAFVLKNIEKLDAHSIPAIFFNFSENQIGSERFYSAIENKLVSMAHQLTTEMLAKCSWGFAMAKTARGSLFFKKAAEAASSKLNEFSIKDMSTLVWSFARSQYGDTQFFIQIEKEIQKRFDSMKAKDCAHLLWAYTQNRPLSIYSVEMMRGIILRDRTEIDCWDLSMILWSFSKFESYDCRQLFIDLEPITIDLIDEMTSQEFLYSFRSYIEMGYQTNQLLESFLKKTEECLFLKNINHDQVYVLLWGYTSLPPDFVSDQVLQIVKKLQERLHELQTLAVLEEEENAKKTPEDELKEDKFQFSDPQFYQDNLELEKLKQQTNISK